MNPLQVFRIALCFALTFVLGGLTGWLLKPSPAGWQDRPGPIPPSQIVMENLDARLRLSPEEKAAVKPILAEWGRKVEPVLRQPRRRRQLFELYAPRVRAVLRSDQLAEYDRMMAETRARFDRRLGRNDGSP